MPRAILPRFSYFAINKSQNMKNLQNISHIALFTVQLQLLISNAAGATTFAITDTKRYVPTVTILTKDNTKLLQQIKSGFRRTTICNKN